MQPNAAEHQTKQTITQILPWSCLKQFRAAGLQQLPILNSSRTNRLACAATQAAIDVGSEGSRIAGEFSFLNRAHEVDASARAVVFIAGKRVSRTSFETEAAMHAREKLLFFSSETRSEL